MSPETRKLLEAARGCDEPTQLDRARVRRRLKKRIAAGAVFGGLLGWGSAAAASSKLIVTAVIAGMLSAALVVNTTASEPVSDADGGVTGAVANVAPKVDPPAIMPAVMLFDSEAHSEPERPSFEDELAEIPDPIVRPMAVRPMFKPKPTPTPEASPQEAAPYAAADDMDALLAETRLLRRAQKALRDGRHDEARAILRQHRIEHPNGQLQNERCIAQARAGQPCSD